MAKSLVTESSSRFSNFGGGLSTNHPLRETSCSAARGEYRPTLDFNPLQFNPKNISTQQEKYSYL